MKVIPNSLLSCFERISNERYGLLYDLAAKGLFSLTELERIVEEFTIQRYNFAKNFHESAKAIPLKADVDARNVVSRNYYAMFASLTPLKSSAEGKKGKNNKDDPVTKSYPIKFGKN